MENIETTNLRKHLAAGQVIPAVPLALESNGSWSEKYQRALIRYYLESGAGGLAIGVHTTQFEIRDPKHNLFEPVLEFCSNAIDRKRDSRNTFAKIAGICGKTRQAKKEASFAVKHGYNAGLLSLSDFGDASDKVLLTHCNKVAEVIPLIGFYLQPAIGGRKYSFDFWKEFVKIENVVAIKIAAFDRYATIDVVRAVAESGRDDIILYTGNDDNIIHDLLTPFNFKEVTLRISGGLLGQWAVGTKSAQELMRKIRTGGGATGEWARLNASLTDFNAAMFDAANNFAGCIAGINEVLHREGLLPSSRCLNPKEKLSPGQKEELDRVCKAYPDWQDTTFIEENLERWLEP